MNKLPDNIQTLIDECNTKHVQVVQGILSGEYESNTAAYQAFYPDSSYDAARSSVADLLAIPSVKSLYDALKSYNVTQGILTRDEAMNILSNMAKHNLSEMVTFGTREITGANGEPEQIGTWEFKDSSELTPELLATISELSSTKDGHKIKTHDQKAAIKQLSDMQGWNKPKEVNITGELKTINEEMSLEDAARVLQDNLKSLGD